MAKYVVGKGVFARNIPCEIWRQINIGPGTDFLSSGNKPLRKPLMI